MGEPEVRQEEVEYMKVLTMGTFDLLHIGHIELFSYGKQFGELVIGLNTDEFVRQYKGELPVQNYDKRYDNIVRFIGIVPIENDSAGRELIESIEPDCIIVGMDWHEAGYLKQTDLTNEVLNDNNILLIYAPRTSGISSSTLREK